MLPLIVSELPSVPTESASESLPLNAQNVGFRLVSILCRLWQ
jgi:hypothetical protein